MPRRKRAAAKRPKGAVRITYTDPDRVPFSYPNNYFVNHGQHEFVLTLAEVPPPASAHMTQQELSALDHVDAVVTARIAMSPSRMKEFASMLVANLEKWEQMYGSAGGEAE